MADMTTLDESLPAGQILRNIHMKAIARSLSGWKVVSGGHVTQHAGTPDMSVDVAAIDYELDSVAGSKVASTTVVVTAADTTPRIDLLYISAAGTITVLVGTPAAITPVGETIWQEFKTPLVADITGTTGTLLAEIYVPADATSILDAYIRELFVPVTVAAAAGAGDTIAPAANTDGSIPVWDGTDSKTLADGYPLVTTLGTPGTDTNLVSEKAIRTAILPVVTTIGTPGADTNVPSEQAVREAITASVGVAPPATQTDGNVPQWDGADAETLKDGFHVVTTVGDPGADTNLATEKAIRSAIAAGGAGTASFWSVFPGTPTRIGNTSFSVTDTGNADLYDLKFGPGTIIKWQKSGGGFQTAKITAASYAGDAVTYTIVGNTLAAGFSDMYFCIHDAQEATLKVPGTLPLAALTGLGTWSPSEDVYIFSGRVQYLTASTTTGGTWDINDDGTTTFTTKLLIAATAKLGTETVCDSLLAAATTAIAAGSEVSIDYDAGHASTPGADAIIHIFFMPKRWRYRQ